MGKPLAQKYGNELAFEVAPDVGAVKADEKRVRQILLNLLSNACKFTDKGTVTIRAWRDPGPLVDTICLQVRDTGIGMTPDQVRRLGELFYQVDASNTKKKGGTPEYLKGPAKEIAGTVPSILNQQFQPYTGDFTAQWTPEQTWAVDEFQGLIDRAGQPKRLVDYYGDYMNPYLEGVLAPQIDQIRDQVSWANNDWDAAANMAGAFGGSGAGAAGGGVDVCCGGSVPPPHAASADSRTIEIKRFAFIVNS